MEYTNKYKMDEALIEALKQKEHIKADISITELLTPTKELVLFKKYKDKIKLDVSKRINALLGTAFHSLLEKSLKNNDRYKTELYLTYEVEGLLLSGTIDLYDTLTATIRDYKTGSVYKYLNDDYEDYKKQLNYYRWLMIKNGYEVKKLELSFFFVKGWDIEKFYLDEEYPPQNIIVEVEKQDLNEVEKEIKRKIKDIKLAKDVVDVDSIPPCTKEERWEQDTKYAVYKNKGDKKAKRVFTDELEAKKYAQINGYSYIETRLGKPRKCLYYCDVKEYCNFYNEYVKTHFKELLDKMNKRG